MSFPDYRAVSGLVARSLGMDVSDLEASFRPATEDDLPVVLRLRSEHESISPHEDDLDYLKWRYEFSGSEAGSRLWVFELRGKIVGLIGIEKTSLTFRGRSWTVHRLMDILLHERQMGSGLGAWMNLHLQGRFENTICIGSTKHSHSIVTKLNTPLPDWQTWRYPIRLRRDALWRPGWVIVNRVLGLRTALKARGVPKGASLRRYLSPPEESEELRNSMSQYCLMPPRSLSRLRWRFEDHPFLRTTYYGLELSGQLVALAVVCTRPPGRADLFDLLCLYQGDPEQGKKRLSTLAIMTVKALANEGVDVVSTLVNDPFSKEALKVAGFVHRPEPCAMGHTFRDPDLAGSLQSGVPLFLMPTDGDFDRES